MQLLDQSNEVRDVLATMADAWAHGDADAYGSVFTEDATYTTFMGTVYSGRRDIVESHRALFRKFLKDTKLSGGGMTIRFPRPDVAIVTSTGDTFKGKPPRKLSKVQTYTLIRQPSGQWLITAFHNTQRKSLLEAVMFRFTPQTRPTA
jgi:uncharacterized protein (TIGR02246 family)